MGAESTFATPQSEWMTLFSGRDFLNWDKFLVTDGKEPIVPNVDPKGVFTVTNTDGESAIHVSGEGYGAITTQAQFTNVHFRIQYKWGLARWGGRAKVGRDSGILLRHRQTQPGHRLVDFHREQRDGERSRPMVER